MVSKKANGIMAVIKRTFTCLDCECFNLLYKSLVRTHLEYSVTTLFPYKMKDIETIEKIQKRATKQVKKIRHLIYSERLKRLNLPTLRYRRHHGDTIEVYKCKGVRCPPIFSLSNLIAGTNRKAYLLHASFALKDSQSLPVIIHSDFTVVQQLMPEHLHTYELS